MIDLFDSEGKLVPPDTIDPLEIEALPEAERAALMACISACLASEQEELQYAENRKRLILLIQELDRAKQAYDDANPAADQIASLRKVIEAQRPGYVSEPERTDPETKELREKAELAVAEARLDFIRSEAACRTLSKAKGEAIAAYFSFKPKITAESVHRSMLKAEAERQLARVARGEPPNPVAPVPAYQSQLDRVMSSNRERGIKRIVRQPR